MMCLKDELSHLYKCVHHFNYVAAACYRSEIDIEHYK